MNESSQPRPRASLADKVHETMRSRILRGDFSPNEKLPAETDLSNQLGVSRPVLRVALERLRDEGLIFSRQGAGNFVKVKQASPLGYAKVETIADIQRCYEFRLTIESAAAGLAAQRRDQTVLDDMQRALDMLSAATGSRMHREDADFAFHVAVASGANNSYYVETLRALRAHIHVGMKLHGESLMSDGATALEEVLAEHKAIFDAIAARDAARAHTVMHAHIEHSRHRLFGASLLNLAL